MALYLAIRCKNTLCAQEIIDTTAPLNDLERVRGPELHTCPFCNKEDEYFAADWRRVDRPDQQ